MKNILLIGLLLLNCAHAQHIKKAVFIIVDGIPAETIESLELPTLKYISSIGGYSRAWVGGLKNGYSQSPTISAVGYNSLLTGTWANKHKVTGNYGKDIDSINYAYQHILKLYKASYPQGKTAIFSTWLDNRTKLLGSKAPAPNNFQPDIHFDGLESDTLNYPHDSAGYYYHLIDEAVAAKAAESIKTIAPDLSWVYLQYTDDMGHKFGYSSEFNHAVLNMDKQIEKIWNAIQYRQHNFDEEWMIIITTDHGRDSSGYHHGGQSDSERSTWIVTNSTDLNEQFKTRDPAIVDIFPTLARWMNITIPEDQAMEIDGISFIGKLSAANARAAMTKDSIHIRWDIIDANGEAEIFISTTNNFKSGGKDHYEKIAEIPVKNGMVSVPIIKKKDFYKIVIQFPNNMLNVWIKPKVI